MKTKPVVAPDAAFPDKSNPPDDRLLNQALGHSFAPVAEILAHVRAAFPSAAAVWHYSRQAGWYRIALLDKRRLFYLVPKHGNFQVTLILGRKAIAALEAGPRAREVAALLKSAKRYPEGTAFSFDRTTCDPSLVAALLDAKLAR